MLGAESRASWRVVRRMSLPDLDDAIDHDLWERVRQSLRDDGLDPDEIGRKAAANLAYCREHPRVPTDEEIRATVQWIMDAPELSEVIP